MLKKLQLSNNNIEDFIVDCYDKYSVINFTKNMFIQISKLREKSMFFAYDSLIISSALLGSCNILYNEDMHNGQIIEDKLTIINRFKENQKI